MKSSCTESVASLRDWQWSEESADSSAPGGEYVELTVGQDQAGRGGESLGH